MKLVAVHVGLAATALFLSIATWAEDVPRVKASAHLEPPAADKARPQRSIRYRTTVGLATDEKYGEMRRGYWCTDPVPLTWNATTVKAVAAPFASLARTELKRLGYTYFEQEASAFGAKESASAEYEIGASIRAIDAQICTEGRKDNAGGVWMQIKWEVFAPRLQRVVYAVTTEGSFASERKIEKPISDFFRDAFLVAFKNALADPGLYERLQSDPATSTEAAAERPKQEALALVREADTQRVFDADFTVLRSSVVTIFSGAGAGSGFYINADGYLLTNYHVVGDAKYVKVKLASGRDLVGEVLRGDRARDVALVKTESVTLRALPIWPNEAVVGDEVYAIGSPFGEFAGSVSRGVLSGNATIESFSFLQSDAKILPGSSGGPLVRKDGSVVGIARSVVGPSFSVSVHLFIPIRDALSRIGVTVKKD